jgi:hypothetical protein
VLYRVYIRSIDQYLFWLKLDNLEPSQCELQNEKDQTLSLVLAIRQVPQQTKHLAFIMIIDSIVHNLCR